MEDSEIVKAMQLCYEILKIVVEPSGAIGLAAVLSESFQKNPAWKDCKHIGIVVSGGNVDMAVLWDSLNKWNWLFILLMWILIALDECYFITDVMILCGQVYLNATS